MSPAWAVPKGRKPSIRHADDLRSSVNLELDQLSWLIVQTSVYYFRAGSAEIPNRGLACKEFKGHGDFFGDFDVRGGEF